MILRNPLFLILIYASMVGCRQSLSDQERLEIAFGGSMKTVVPVGGTVLVNGNAEPGVFVRLHSEDGSRPAQVRPAVTDEDGNFQFTTYLQGDGVEPGKYKLTFQWLKMERLKKEGIRTTGPDKLKNAYNDPKKSEFQIEVEEDAPQTDLEYHLKVAN